MQQFMSRRHKTTSNCSNFNINKIRVRIRLLRIMRSLKLAKNSFRFIFPPTTHPEELTMEQSQMAYIYIALNNINACAIFKNM